MIFGRSFIRLCSAPRFTGMVLVGLLAIAVGWSGRAYSADAPPSLEPAVGARGRLGCLSDPTRVSRLVIDSPGLVENVLVDGDWAGRSLVKINADRVTLRHCEIRNARHNGIAVEASDVLIDSCRIHHLLKGTSQQPEDAHGITGCARRLVIRNCEIFLVSGDAVQFDPDRGPWDDVLIERCTFWTGPLESDWAGFRQADRPGENAVDTKQQAANSRSRLVIRDCLFHGWRGGFIKNQAALNLKNHVEVTVSGCVFRDNDICFRLRGGAGERGGARVRIDNCALYDSNVALRMEDGIRDLKIDRLGIGEGIRRPYKVARGIGPGFEQTGTFRPVPFEQAVALGVTPLTPERPGI